MSTALSTSTAWLVLLAAGVLEIVWSVSMKASAGFTKLHLTIVTIVVAWLARWSIPLARVALGVVFVWFGGLKFFPGLSPAQELAGRTIETLTLGIVEPGVSRPLESPTTTLFTPWTRWLLVRMYPASSMMTPDPLPAAAPCCI